MRAAFLLLVALAAAGSAGCASAPRASRTNIGIETQKPVAVSGSGLERTVSAAVHGGDTVVKIGGARFNFRDYAGYLGSLGTDSGWVQIGKVTLRYDRAEATVQTPKNWSTFRVVDGLNIYVHQDGRTGRNVFKD